MFSSSLVAEYVVEKRAHLKKKVALFFVIPCVQVIIKPHVHPVLLPESLYLLPSHSIC
jgi:hypothetical protein